MMALSIRNDNPKTASRPFDKNRDGFVMGEGGGAIILEEYQHIKQRGAKIVRNCWRQPNRRCSSVAAPHPEGLGAKNVMKQAIEESGQDKRNRLYKCSWHLNTFGRYSGNKSYC